MESGLISKVKVDVIDVGTMERSMHERCNDPKEMSSLRRKALSVIESQQNST